ncbi:hypothetical protein SAMN05216464_11491 [Mucilaginibacter pineti]|uniref:LiaF transmembrane domain-containing protein n=1 Tax=Mucilaginibacter pineti TaxID=1391627 RepID=A0A1G7J807_9SPHI|nr:DUF5668 domain-containing protein [Mucilaginibacter pineti]SDF21117.1 hypothetical protein SAMN05216464_11491 [Mucilaginibacter pineti]
MNNDIETSLNPNNGKAAAGVILLVIGSVLLIRQFDFFEVPDWLFSWPMWMISWGLYMGAKYNFRKPSWILITLIGVACLLDNNIDNADRIVWPVAIMGFGVWLVLKPKKQKEEYYFGNKKETFHFDKAAEPEA